MKEFAIAEFQRANRTLSSARLLSDSDPDSAASRAYYAAFHAITSLFALRDKRYSKHTAIRAAVHKELILADEWDEELGKAYDFLLDAREKGDYGGTNQVSISTAEIAIDRAQMIIDAVKKTCPELI